MRLKKYDRDASHSYTFGVFPTLELLYHQPKQVSEVLLTTAGAQNEGVAKIKTLCSTGGIPISTDDKLVERIAPKENTYAVGVFAKYSPIFGRPSQPYCAGQPIRHGQPRHNFADDARF